MLNNDIANRLSLESLRFPSLSPVEALCGECSLVKLDWPIDQQSYRKKKRVDTHNTLSLQPRCVGQLVIMQSWFGFNLP